MKSTHFALKLGTDTSAITKQHHYVSNGCEIEIEKEKYIFKKSLLSETEGIFERPGDHIDMMTNTKFKLKNLKMMKHSIVFQFI